MTDVAAHHPCRVGPESRGHLRFIEVMVGELVEVTHHPARRRDRCVVSELAVRHVCGLTVQVQIRQFRVQFVIVDHAVHELLYVLGTRTGRPCLLRSKLWVRRSREGWWMYPHTRGMAFSESASEGASTTNRG